jgi:hypothetical protein
LRYIIVSKACQERWRDMPCETLATFLYWKGAKSCPAEMQEQISQSFFEIDNQNNITPLTVKSQRSFFCSRLRSN